MGGVGIEEAVAVHSASVFCAGVTRPGSCNSNDDNSESLVTSGESLVTSGGRVLTVVVTHRDITTAVSSAQLAAEAVNFTGKTYRTDIARKALQSGFVAIIIMCSFRLKCTKTIFSWGTAPYPAAGAHDTPQTP